MNTLQVIFIVLTVVSLGVALAALGMALWILLSRRDEQYAEKLQEFRRKKVQAEQRIEDVRKRITS